MSTSAIFSLTLYQTTRFWTGPKLKAFANDKLDVSKMFRFTIDSQ